jgi:hypothetical protein
VTGKLNRTVLKEWIQGLTIIAFSIAYPVTFIAISYDLSEKLSKGPYSIYTWLLMNFGPPVILFWWLPIRPRRMLIPVIALYLFCVWKAVPLFELAIACTGNNSCGQL